MYLDVWNPKKIKSRFPKNTKCWQYPNRKYFDQNDFCTPLPPSISS